MNQEIKWWHYLIAFIPPLMGSVSYVTSKFIINDISPISLLFYRWLVALIMLTPFAIKSFIYQINIVIKNLGILFVIGLSGVTFFNLFVYYALQYTTSTNTSIIIGIFPLFVLGFGVLINKEKLKSIQIFSILFSFLGVMVILSHGQIIDEISGLFNNKGDFLALISSLCWAIYVFAVKYKPKNLSFVVFVYSTILIGTLFILPLYLFDIYYLGNIFKPNVTNLSVIFCLGLGVSIIGMTALNISIVKLGPNISSLLFYFAPLFTSTMAAFILDEEFELYHLIGISLIVVGVNLSLIVKFLTLQKCPILEFKKIL